MSGRVLIVNADDLGLSPAVNRGVAKAHDDGIVTSASLMVRQRAAAEAAALARKRPALSLGLHVDLGEWSLRGDEWVPLYEVVATDDRRAVSREVSAQLASFRRLTGCDPTHLDSHQHVHLAEPVATVVVRLGQALSVPVRHRSPHVTYCGEFYGQTRTGVPTGALTAERLVAVVEALPPGVTELACHPADGVDHQSPYAAEREVELAVLCDVRVRAAIVRTGISLRSFGDRPWQA